MTDTVKEELLSIQRRLDNDWTDGLRTLESAVKRVANERNTYAYYSAVQEPDGTVFAVIYHITTDEGQICFKGYGENDGPGYYGCPKSILDRLTPTDDVSAYLWREICRGRLPKDDGEHSWDLRSEGVETVEQAKAWIEKKRKELAAKKAERPKICGYVRFKQGTWVELDGIKYSIFLVVDSKKGMSGPLKPYSDDGVPHKSLIKLPPRKALKAVEFSSGVLSGVLPRKAEAADNEPSVGIAPKVSKPSLFDYFGLAA
jgi:hypothetical protein